MSKLSEQLGLIGGRTPDPLLGLLREARDMLAKSKRAHYYCEDCWYSCPKAIDGCCNEAAGDECDCGADTFNARIDAFLARLDAALTPPEFVDDPIGEYVDVDTPPEAQGKP